MSNTENNIDNLSQDEIKLNLNDRFKTYKLTILICVIYSVIAFLLIFLGLFTTWGNKFLFGDIISFVITFSIGSILVVLYLSNLIYNLKFKKIDNSNLNNDMCPDYWELKVAEEVNKNTNKGVPYLSNTLNPLLFKYKCVKNNSLFNNEDIIKSNPDKNFQLSKNNNDLYINLDPSNDVIGISSENDKNNYKYKNFQKYATYMNGYSYNDDNTITKNNEELSLEKVSGNDNIPSLNCSKVFPVYLSAMDKQNIDDNKEEPSNRYRCAYAKACGVSWTEAGCY